jgi:uncharacterized protein (TIGR02266 family)
MRVVRAPIEERPVSDAATTAKSARESLARGLSALQSDPNVPPQLLDLAAPIAQAMGALHQIERSGGTQLVPHAEIALNNVRTALGALQTQPSQHPAVVGAMEAVAGSLGLVHALAKMAQAPQAAPPQPQYQQPPPQAQYQQPPPQQYQQPPAQQYQQAPQQQPGGFPPQQQGPTAFQRPSQDAFAGGGAPPQQFQQQPPQQQYQQPPPQQQYQPPPQQQQVRPPNAQQANPFGATAVVSDQPVINADLGAHSPTNFYKGLSGNDIIDHGGLFVSTYKIPKIGTPVRLKVSLPGGYEFEANAVVRWSREQSDAGNDAPPGFGAQFTEITPEARQLVYRYVRNREPLFHDDF